MAKKYLLTYLGIMPDEKIVGIVNSGKIIQDKCSDYYVFHA